MAVIRVPKFWPGSNLSESSLATASGPALVAAAPGAADGLLAFGSEAIAEPPLHPAIAGTAEVPATGWTTTPRTRGLATLVAAVVMCASAFGGMWLYRARVVPIKTGSLTIQTSPAGLEVLIGGATAGRTPLTVNLAPGTHAVQVGSADRRRNISVTIAAGGSVVHEFEFAPAATPAAPAPVSLTGSLRVQTDPARLAVTVDDIDRGLSPVTIADLPAGDHQVVVRGPSGAVRRTVTIKPQDTLALVITPIAPAVPAPGWLAVSAPITLQLREGGRLIGTTDTDRMMLPSGDHDIELVNEPLGYRSLRRVAVGSGQTAQLRIEVPNGTLSINALPWAEVWIGGERIGETPIANLPQPIGSHEIVFRHPQLGERRETVVVTMREPARLGIDMRRR